MTSDRTPGADPCTEAKVGALVHSFYARVHQDEVLGPIFESHIDDWNHHLAELVDFLVGHSARHRPAGILMAKHAALPGLSAALFERWLRLFCENAAEQPNQARGEQACAMAARIAQACGWATRSAAIRVHCPWR